MLIVLTKMKKIAEVYHQHCHRITSFSDSHCYEDACMFAGFFVTEIINEPTVTAIYHLCFGQDIEAKVSVLIFDLESGHLDDLTIQPYY